MRIPQKNQLLAVILLANFVPWQMNAGPATLPAGGAFTAGKGTIATSGNTLTINQSGNRGIINWNNFTIGPNAVVSFKNGSGATLNLVNGGAISSILGTLLATGSVYLMNPQGIVIGARGRINTGGDFIASSLKVSKEAFMGGGQLLFQGGSNAIVKNLGNISSTGGSVFLIGNAVQNDGSVNAPVGTVGLGAGQSILLKDSSSDQRIFVQASGGDITNSGSLSGAEVELKSSGGNIYALAGNNGGQIRATGTATKNGQVWLVANGGKLTVSGAISAENADGTGGAIETSGHSVTTSNAAIHTGQGGNWLVDPADLLIDSSMATTIEGQLATGNVTEQTSSAGTGGLGDIQVNSSITWNTANSLTLSAYHDIDINGVVTITNTSSGNLTLRADNTSTGVGNVIFNYNPQIIYSGSTGNVSIISNPSGSAGTKYTNPANYSSAVTTNGSWVNPNDGSVNSQLTAYMLVNNMTDLQNVNTNVNGNYALGTNLDATGVNFTYLGNNNTTGYFTGIFDGQGHTISNLTISSNADGYVGLFGWIRAGGTIRNLGLMNESVSGGINVGGLVGYNQGKIYGSFVNGQISGTNTGGITAINQGSISNSYAGGRVTGANGNSGGLVYQNLAIINSSYSTAIASCGLVCTESGTTNTSYWDVNSSGTSNSASGGSGYRTDLQDGTLPGFSSTIWGFGGTNAAIYPYLLWQVPTGATPVPVSGYTYTNQSQLSKFVNTPVKGIANGADLGQTVYTAADGYYYFLMNSFSASPGSGLITYLPQNANATAFYNNVQGHATMPITSGYVAMLNTPVSLTAAVAAMNTTGGTLISQDNLPFSVTPGNLLNLTPGTYLDVTTPGVTVKVDQSLTMNKLILETLTGGGFTQTSPINVTDLSLLGSAAFSLTNSGNMISVLATGPSRVPVVQAPSISPNTGPLPLAPVSGSLKVFSETNLELGTTDAAHGIYTTGSGIITTSGSLTIDPETTVEAVGAGVVPAAVRPNQQAVRGLALLLADGTTFINNSGAAALNTPNGYWQVWSQNPADDTRGGELYNFKQYNATYGTTSPGQSTGNGFLYTLAPTLTTTFANVTKQYDSTVTAAINTESYTPLTGAVDGDTVTLVNLPASGSYSNKNAGTNKTVTVIGITASATALSGDATVYGYTVNPAVNVTSTITKAPLTVTTTASNKVYDGTTAATGTATLSTPFEGDVVGIAPGGTFAFNDSNAGTSKPVNVSGLTLGGTDAANYFLEVQNTATANITPAPLYYSANGTSRPYGTNNPLLTGLITGLVVTDTLASVLTGNLTFATSAAPDSVLGAYPIVGSGVTLISGNYTLSQSPANSNALTVGQLILSINNLTNTVGQPNVFGLSYNGSSSLAIDLSALANSVQFQTSPSNSSNAGIYQINASYPSLASSIVFNPGILTVLAALPTAPVAPAMSPAPIAPPMPSVLYVPPPPMEMVSQNILAGPNTAGVFQIGYSSAFDWTSFLAATGNYQSALANSSSFLVTPTSETPTSDYIAGIHQ